VTDSGHLGDTQVTSTVDPAASMAATSARCKLVPNAGLN
jgi:hypothetical protein